MGREGSNKRLKKDNETGVGNGYQEGSKEEKETQQGRAEEGRPSTPVTTKIERWNRRIKEEGRETGVRTPSRRQAKIERPIGKEKLLQPTLSSFLSLKSGLKGSGGK